MTRYTETGTYPGCLDWGAIVFNRGKHDEWHARLDDLAGYVAKDRTVTMSNFGFV